MDRPVDADPSRSCSDVRAWLFEQIHADPDEAQRVVRGVRPQLRRRLDGRAWSPFELASQIRGETALCGIVAHRAWHKGREIAVLLVESRRRSCEESLRRAVASVVRSLRRGNRRRRVFVVFVAR
jgi:hypothetical protein